MATFGTLADAMKPWALEMLKREMAKTPAEVAADRLAFERRQEAVTITRGELERLERDSLELGVWRVWGKPPSYNRHGELLNHPTHDTRKLCHVVRGGGPICTCGKK